MTATFKAVTPETHPHVGPTLHLLHQTGLVRFDDYRTESQLPLFSVAVADRNDLINLAPQSRLGVQFREYHANALAPGTRLLIDGATEGWSFDGAIVAELHAMLDALDIRPEDVVLVTTNHLFQPDYCSWCELNGKRPIKIFAYDYWAYKIAAELIQQSGSIDTALTQPPRAIEIDKKLLSYNRIFKAHRAAVVLELQKNGQLGSSHVSFMPDSSPLSEGERAQMGQYLFSLGWPTLTDRLGDWDVLAAKVPLTADMTSNDAYLTYVFGTIMSDIYSRIGFAVITESDFGVARVDRVTEKPFKAIANRCPFILVGQPGQLARLKALGFVSADFIDEAYDEIQDADLRLKACLHEIDRLSQESFKHLGALRTRFRSAAEQNYANLVRLGSAEVLVNIAGGLRGAICG